MLPLEKESRWQKIASLHTLRRGLAVTAIEVGSSSSILFAIGGLDDQSCFPHVEIYDPERDSWSFGPKMHESRGGVACAAIHSNVYAIGGNDGSYSVDSGEMLDPVIGRWLSIGRMRHRRAGAGLAVVNGCLWIAGGFDENVPLNAVEFFDPRIGAWQKGPNMLTPRGGVGLASMGFSLFAVGGHDGNDYLSSVECFDPRMFVASFDSSANDRAQSSAPGDAYSSMSSASQSNSPPPGEWCNVASLSNGRAGAGLVHIQGVIPTWDMPVMAPSYNDTI